MSLKKKKLKIIVVMPAYNAEKTLERTVKDLPKNFIDEIILVDDASRDNTVEIAKRLGLSVYVHKKNKGYGGNQKTCYKKALKKGADIVIMVHPDYQYDSSLCKELVEPIINGRFDIMFGSRIRTRKEALEGGMPWYKYFINRLLTENFILGVNFSEHLSGFRAYNKEVLKTIPFVSFSDDFVFDQQFMISAIAFGFRVGEIPIPVRYFSESSSIKFLKGGKFLIGTFFTLFLYILFKTKIYKSKIFDYRKK
jgi:glycosyltransferase involved in cell wall biosynthesis